MWVCACKVDGAKFERCTTHAALVLVPYNLDSGHPLAFESISSMLASGIGTQYVELIPILIVAFALFLSEILTSVSRTFGFHISSREI